VRRGGDEHAAELGMNPSSSIVGAFEMGDETVFHETYRTWRSLLRHGLERDLAHGVALGERA
jgi:hypothetical protein